MTHVTYALGFDLGGTNIRAAVVGLDGRIVAREHAPTPYTGGQLAIPAAWVETMAHLAAPLLAVFPVMGVGLGAGGQYDPATGVLRGIMTGDPRFVNYPLGERLHESLRLPVYVDNDVKAAALAELHYGAGRGLRHLLCVGIGTGIGGALILDGRLYHGSSGLAGHIGQMLTLDAGHWLEAVGGGEALRWEAEASGILREGETGEILFIKARAGDSHARALLQSAAAQVGRALAGLAHVLEPEAILLGGTVGVQPEVIAAVNAELRAHLLPNWQHITARAMQLGPDAGQIGAAARVFVEHGLLGRG